MSAISSCFWSLLSLDDLRFIYIPEYVANIKVSGTCIKKILLNHSLYEFIHPNEIELAKYDLSSFLKIKTLSGSVTRCRLRSFDHIVESLFLPPSSLPQQDVDTISDYYKFDKPTRSTDQKNDIWRIIDLVIYTATDDTVLAFFHNTDFGPYYRDNNKIGPSHLGCCRGKNNFAQEDAIQLVNTLKRGLKENMTHNIAITPLRIFQIVDQNKGTTLFTWPQPLNEKSASLFNSVQSIAKEMVLKQFKNSSFKNSEEDDIVCTRHYYASETVNFMDEPRLFQRILIPYGTIIFESFQVSSDIKLTHVLPLYQHYFINMDITHSSFDTQSVAKCEYITENIFEVETQTPRPLKDINQDFLNCPNPKYHLPIINDPTNRPPLVRLPSTFESFPKVNFQRQEFEQLSLPQPKEISTVEKRRRILFEKHDEPTNQTSLTSSANMRPESGNVKICARCRTNNSPEWRRGPDGHKTLCNACGLRYSRFRSKQWRTPNNMTIKK